MKSILFRLPVLLLIALILPSFAAAQGSRLPADGTVIEEIRVEGLNRLTPNRILRRMTLEEGDSFFATAYRQDLQAIASIGTIDPLELEINWEENSNNTIDLIVSVVENPAIELISFIGNTKFTTKELTAQLDYEVGDLMPTDVRSATARNMRSFYRRGGYKATEVMVEVMPATEVDGRTDTVRIIINVDEGSRIKIKKVSIQGNDYFSDFYLKSQLSNAPGFLFFKNYYDIDAVDDDLAILRQVHQNAGFLDAESEVVEKIYNEQEQEISLIFSVKEGPQYQVRSVATEGITYFTAEEIEEITDDLLDKRFKGSRLNRALEKIRRLYGDQGYIDTTVSYRVDKNPEARAVTVILEVDESPEIYVGEVRLDLESFDYEVDISGFDRFLNSIAPPTKPETVYREVRLEPGKKYRSIDEIRTIERLRNLGIFKNVAISRESTPDPQVRDAMIYAEEDPAAAYVGISAGIGEQSGPTASLQFEHPNVGGNADQLRAGVTVGENNLAFTLGYFDRYLGDSDVSLRTLAYHATDRYEVYDQKRTGAYAEFGYPLQEHLTTFLRFKGEYVDFTDIDDDPTPDEDFDDYFAFTARPTIVYDKRDNYRFPTRGYLLSGGVEVGEADGFLFKILNTYEYYTQPFEKNDLIYAFEQNLGFLPYNADQVGFNERFFAGGSSSLRGFEARGVGPRDSANDDLVIGGATQIIQRHELRYPFNDAIAGRVFLDGAIIERSAFSVGEPRIGTGVGALLNLGPVGVEVDFAVPVLYRDEDDTQFFHLRLGSNF